MPKNFSQVVLWSIFFVEEGLIIMFVNVITKLYRCAAAGSSCPAHPKDTAGV